MESKMALLRRGTGSAAETDLLIVLLVLVIVSILCVGALWFLRRKRRAREVGLLPMHAGDEKLSTPAKKGHRRLSGITISSSVSLNADRQPLPKYADEEKQGFMVNTTPPPSAGPLPQIHITFPEETDDSGKRQSGRVVVVHVDDKGGVGMEPVHSDESLPPYEAERFVSLDLERIGGLKEKEYITAQPN